MSDSKQYFKPAGLFPSRWRWLFFLLGSVLLLVVLYGLGRLGHVALGSFYSGERGPYLQQPAATAMTLRWQTLDAEIGVVRYGYQPDQLNWQQQESRAGEEHEVRLTGLRPATRYYYAIGTTATTHYAGENYWFTTPPPSGEPRATRVVVLGDPGYPGPGQVAVRDAIQDWLDANPRPGRAAFDLLLTTGDNAYRSGTNEQFQAGFFAPYANWLRNVPVWPVYGNHDARRWAFFDLFSFPASSESGGLPSGTEHYYAFDFGQVHFVILDTQASSLRAGAAMLRWLEKDLAESQQPWVIVAFHHPPYTHGSHDSDSRADSSGRMFEVRQQVVPLLEKAGVDLVLSGHSHMYERSHLLGCHYGTSDTLETTMLQQPRIINQQSLYTKPAAGRVAHQGTIYAVVGSSSKVDNGPLDHPAMAVAYKQRGALVVDINGPQLTGRFITDRGQIADRFAIVKGDSDTPALRCTTNNQ